jgi:hypothetical protein
MDGVRLAALAAQDGTFAHCASAKTASSLDNVVFHDPPTAPGPLEVDLTCDTPCTYEVHVIDLQDGRPVANADGDANGEKAVSIAADGLGAGSYQYTLRVFAYGKPGTAVDRYSRPFTITPPPPTLAPLLPLLPSLPTLDPTT